MFLTEVRCLAVTYPVSPSWESQAMANETLAPMPEDVRRFVESTAWRFAKTYADTWPHEYMVRQPRTRPWYWPWLGISSNMGWTAASTPKSGRYHREGGKVYWSMDDTPEETDLINRCEEAQTWEARLAAGTLPK